MPRPRACLADVANFAGRVKEGAVGDGCMREKRRGECTVLPAVRRLGGGKRKSVVLGGGNVSEDELGM